MTMSVTERYHRTDIPCAVGGCGRCERNKDLAAQGIPMLRASDPILVPDVSVVSRYIEVLEQGEELGNMVFCQTVMDALDRRNRTRTMRNVRRIAADSRRRAVVFANEVSVHTAVPAGPAQTPALRDMLAVLSAARWYRSHLGPESTVAVLTLKDYSEITSGDRSGVLIWSMADFIGQYHSGLQPLFESVTEATADGEMDITAMSPAQYAAARLQAKAQGEFSRHLSPADIADGLRRGELVQGKIRVLQRSRGVIERGGGLPDIDIVGRAALNRACSGDTVVVRLLGHAEASAHREQHGMAGSGNGKHSNGNNDDDDDGSNADETDSLAMLADAGEEPPASLASRECQYGVVVGVAQRSWRPYVATLQADDTGGARHLAVPVDANVPKIRMHYMDAASLEGQYFVVCVDSWPADSQYPQGHFVRTLGPVSSLDTQIDAILVERQIATSQAKLKFAAAVLREMPEDSAGAPWVPGERDLQGRRDLRDWLVFSIDPRGCVDIDDAMSIRCLSDGGVELGVHIADVAHFIKPGSAADQEARARGTTVYLADRRFNMIPEVLSERVCSLHAGVDRLAVSVIWNMDSEMRPRGVWFGRSVIRSACELSYEQAQAMLDGEPGGLDPMLEPSVRECIVQLTRAMRTVRARRMADGALELASTEVKFGFDEVTSEVTELATKKSLEVHRVVEEAMVLANAAVARRIHEAFPQSALLRRHRSPTGDRFERLVRAVASRGFAIDHSSNAALARSLAAISQQRADDPDLVFLTKTMATLAMQEADYFATGDCEASSAYYHYGLALGFYTHFTSPIRRYADIVVHRQLLDAVAGNGDIQLVGSQQWVAATANLLNERNRQSKLAQRESAELFQSRFVVQRTRNSVLVADGVVAEIRTHGLIVYVPQLGLRGPVHLQDSSSGYVRMPLSIVSGKPGDADTMLDGCSDFVAEPTQLRLRLPSSAAASAVGVQRDLRFAIFDHVRVLVRVLDTGRRRPQVYLTLVGGPHKASVGAKKKAHLLADSLAAVRRAGQPIAATDDKAADADNGDSTDEENDSGELWISPKISRAATLQTSESQSTQPAPVLRQVYSETTHSDAVASADRQKVHSRRKAHVRRKQQQQQEQQLRGKGVEEEAGLSGARIVAWYVPRVAMLFVIGWLWSVVVQLMHAQQRSLDPSRGGSAVLGMDDSSDSDDTDMEFPYEMLFGWRSLDAGDLTRDLIGRVLGQAAWCNGISGLLTVLVGLAYPYLDYKWQSFPQYRPGWNNVLRCAGGFLGVNYAAMKLPFQSANQSALILIIISLGLWTVCDGTLHGWLLSMNASLVATWLLLDHALTNLDPLLTRDDYLGLLSCLPSVLFTYCIMTGCIGRRLASGSPLWPRPSLASQSTHGLRAVSSSSASGFIL
ncbi:hypothetical protein LPJ56_000451 [Coemansia sp. RSA 2599]|nr:hypothetical protein LPJ56_000451 [Coemansia sp. RSA 2599]